MTTSPTQRTLAACRKAGWPAAVVEKWNQWARVRQDLFGGLDILALAYPVGVLGIQATSASNVAARLTKLRGLIDADGSALSEWLARGNQIEVWGWKKVGSRWTVRKIQVTLGGHHELA